MKWRCSAKDFNGKYCNGTPEWENEPYEKKIAGAGEEATPDYVGGVCKLNPETCGKCQGLLEQLDPVMLEKIKKPTYIETITLIKAEEKTGAKPKSVKAKKFEQEMAQRSMF